MYALPPAPLTLVELLEDLTYGGRVRMGLDDVYVNPPFVHGRDSTTYKLHLGGRRNPRLSDENPWD